MSCSWFMILLTVSWAGMGGNMRVLRHDSGGEAMVEDSSVCLSVCVLHSLYILSGKVINSAVT